MKPLPTSPVELLRAYGFEPQVSNTCITVRTTDLVGHFWPTSQRYVMRTVYGRQARVGNYLDRNGKGIFQFIRELKGLVYANYH
jgi:hypothetical protein